MLHMTNPTFMMHPHLMTLFLTQHKKSINLSLLLPSINTPRPTLLSKAQHLLLLHPCTTLLGNLVMSDASYLLPRLNLPVPVGT